MRDPMHVFPFGGAGFEPRNARTNFVVENFRAAARNRIESGIAQARDRIAHRKPRNLGDAQNFRRRKTVQMHLRKFLLDRAQHVLVELNPKIRMQAALHQHTRAANLDHLPDLFVDCFERKDVAVFRPQRPVKRAERAILCAEIRVVNVAVNLISSYARVGFLAAHFVRSHSYADQIVGIKKLERLFLCDSHRRLSSSASAVTYARYTGSFMRTTPSRSTAPYTPEHPS